MKCRFCGNSVTIEFSDLGNSPTSNSFLNAEQLFKPETFYPLRVMVCDKCFLVQIDEYAKHDDIFNDQYAYFSSYSKSWLDHAKRFTEMMVSRFGYGPSSLVVEIASNDGYLLQYFKEKGIPVLGIEPTENTAAVAKAKGIESIIKFFGKNIAIELAKKDTKADLLIGNNVLAHVPDINDFVSALKTILKPNGVITIEFPHLLNLIEKKQFDTIYHEHFSYLSFSTVKKIFEYHGLELFDVQKIPTHGGSLRIFGKHKEDNHKAIEENVYNLVEEEIRFGLNKIEVYQCFQDKIVKVKNDFLEFLIQKRKLGKTIAAYGAAAKGNTFLNFAGIRKDLISYVVDASPYKQNKFLPGIHIPVVNEDWILESKPDYIVILPWNLKGEICQQLDYIRDWNGKFVVAIPELSIF